MTPTLKVTATSFATFFVLIKQMIMPVKRAALFNAAQTQPRHASTPHHPAEDYVRTARAKGMTERVVLLVHVLRNSLIPVVTVIAPRDPDDLRRCHHHRADSSG